jgi:hypothetical protein
MPNANITTYQKYAYYVGIKLFNIRPAGIKSLNHDLIAFKLALNDSFI